MIPFIFISFLIWRLLLFVIAYGGTFLFDFNPRFPYADIFLYTSGLPSFIWSFANFDGVHYLTISLKGYAAQFTQVFFPVYPLLLSAVQKIFYFANPVLSGLIISNLIFLAALYIFYFLLMFDYRRENILFTVLFILIFPTSFYFASLYTEGLFLALTLSTFYLARRGKWIMASFLAATASATRLIGIFLLPALLYEWYLTHRHPAPSRGILTHRHPERSRGIYLLKSPVLYLAPLGLIFYMLFLQLKYNDALYFWHAQPVFGAARSGSGIILLPQVFWRYFKILTSVSVKSLSFWIPLTELSATVFALTLLVVAHFKKIRVSYLIYSWPSLVLPTLTGTLSSMPRYILLIFPIFIALGLIRSNLWKIILLITFLLLLITFTIIFTRGLWIA